MQLLKMSDLVYDDYCWTVYGGDDPKVSGEPDSTLLNRKEGYEVLYFINKFVEFHNLKQITSGLKTEKMIHDALPSNIRSQKNVKSWLEKEWSNYN